MNDQDVGPTTYNFHGLFAVRVVHRGLNALMRRELGIFIDEEVESIDLRIEEGKVRTPSWRLEGGYAFDDSAFVVETPSGLVQLQEGLIRAGTVLPYELLRWVTNAMRRHLFEKEVPVLHAAASARDGRAHVFPAWAQTGKTNLQLNLLANGYDYMSDDWCPVSASGEVFAYPRYLNLYEYNFTCHPGLIDAFADGQGGRALRRRVAASKFARSLDGSNWLTGILQRRLLDFFYVHARVPVTQIIEGCGTALQAPLGQVCLLTVKAGASEVSEISPDHLAHKVALINHFEQLPFMNADIAMDFAGLRQMEVESLSKEEELLARIFGRTACLAVTVPPHATGKEIDRVRRLLEKA